MPRIPYVDADIAEPAALVNAIRERRGGELLHLDRVLLHSPPFAAGWNEFLGKVRRDLALPARLMELAICVVAVLNRAHYEFSHHEPLYAAAGAGRAELDALRGLDDAAADLSAFDAAEQAVVRLTRELTQQVHITAPTYAAARRCLGDDRQMLELVGVVAAYNMVSRMLVAFDIEPER